MKTAALVDVGQVEVQERDQPTPADGELLVQVEACGVCKTDYHMYHGTFPVTTPLVLGHESAGVVVESASPHFDTGERVALNPTVPCNTCSACKAGRTNLCENNTSLGGAGDTIRDGAFAEYIAVPATNVEPIGDLETGVAALAEPLACCIHGVDRAGVESGDSAALIGAGPIGLLILQTLRNRGVSDIVVSEPDPQRRRLAAELGADQCVNPEEGDLTDTVQRRSGGVDIAIEAVGSTATIEQAEALTARGGVTLVFGVPPQDEAISLFPFDLFFEERSVVGAFSLTQRSFERAVALLRGGRIDADPLITHHLGLGELPEAFDRMDRGDGLKQVVRPKDN